MGRERTEGRTHAWRQQRNGLFGLAAAVKRRRRIIICLVPHAPLQRQFSPSLPTPTDSKNDPIVNRLCGACNRYTEEGRGNEGPTVQRLSVIHDFPGAIHIETNLEKMVHDGNAVAEPL